jgi:(2Fe-2S) ferredoxin
MGKEIKVPDKVIYVCNGSKCKKCGGKELRKFFEKLTDDAGFNIQVIKTGCTDNCRNAPVVCVQPDNVWYAKTDFGKAKEIVEEMKEKKI